MHAPTGTECNIVLETPSVEYETYEEEFSRPGSRKPIISAQAQTPSLRASKCKNTAKQRLQPRACSGYHLSYLSMWWLRMEREGKREEEERKKREEEAKRGVRMKRWLERKRSMSVKKGLGPPGPGEGGVSNPVVDKFEKCPDINSLLRGGECFTRERGQRVEGEGGVVTETDNVITERSQPRRNCILKQNNFEHHGFSRNRPGIDSD